MENLMKIIVYALFFVSKNTREMPITIRKFKIKLPVSYLGTELSIFGF